MSNAVSPSNPLPSSNTWTFTNPHSSPAVVIWKIITCMFSSGNPLVAPFRMYHAPPVSSSIRTSVPLKGSPAAKQAKNGWSLLSTADTAVSSPTGFASNPMDNQLSAARSGKNANKAGIDVSACRTTKTHC